MKLLQVRLLVCSTLIVFGVAACDESAPQIVEATRVDKPMRTVSTPPIAVSGRVEVNEVLIVRRKVSDADPKADLTNMKISFWIHLKDKGLLENCYVHLVKLDPVVDDRQRILLTETRRSGNDCLQSESPVTQTKSGRGRNGPVVTMTLDAPSRGATVIKKLKGQFRFTSSRTEDIEFQDLRALAGKPLTHKALGPIKIVPVVGRDGDFTTIALHVTGQKNRLLIWAVKDDGKVVNPISEEKNRADALIRKTTRRFRFHPTRKTTLVISIRSPNTREEVVDFEFTNLALP